MSDDFDLFGDTAPKKEEPKQDKGKKKNSKLYKGLGAVGIVALVAGVGYAMSNDEPEPEPEPEPVAVDVPLINAEQRDWAGLVCNGSKYWNGKMALVTNSSGSASPVEARKNLKGVLDKNVETANKYAESVRGYPERANTSASDNQAVPSVTVLEKEVGDEPDDKVTGLSQDLASAIATFANDMSEASTALSQPSDYDGAGIREAISQISTDVSDSTSRFGDDLDSVLTSDIFDNVTTLNVASSLPSCSNVFTDRDQIDSLSDEIEDESIIRSSAVLNRCEDHVERARNAFGEDGKAEAADDASDIEKQKVSVFNSDVDRCTSIIANPGFDKNAKILENGVNPVPASAVSNELPESVSAAADDTDSSESASPSESESAAPTSGSNEPESDS